MVVVVFKGMIPRTVHSFSLIDETPYLASKSVSGTLPVFAIILGEKRSAVLALLLYVSLSVSWDQISGLWPGLDATLGSVRIYEFCIWA